MDYNGRDVQRQNLNLAGERNSKLPPVLRPYALPKVDFDNSLQGTLRFDSLVETGAFLGNEDEQWIEDFSQVGSGIKFSSSTEEPCPISRQNNVWSEVDSSEFVEMLLKSVDQEEIVPLQTNSKESDACDELSCIINVKQMDPGLRMGGNIPFGVGDDKQPVLSSDDIATNTSVLDNIDGGLYPDVEGSIQSHKVLTSTDGESGNFRGTSVDTGLMVTEGSEFADKKCKDLSKIEVDSVVGGSFNIVAQRISSSEIEVGGAVSSGQDTIMENDELTNENASNNVETAADNVQNLDVSYEMSPGIKMTNDQNLNAEVIKAATPGPSCFPKAEPEVEVNTDESKLDNVEEPTCTIQKNDSGFSEDVLVMNDQSELNMHKESGMGSKGHTISEKHDFEEPRGTKLVNEDLVSGHGVSVLGEDNDGPHDIKDKSGKSPIADKLTAVCAPPELLGERNSEVHLSSSIAVQSLQISETITASSLDDFHKLEIDAPIKETEHVALSTCIANVDSQASLSSLSEEGVGSFCSVEGTESDIMVLQLKSDAAAVAERSVDGLPVPSANEDIQDVIGKRSVESLRALVFGSIHYDKGNDLAIKSSSETSSLDVSKSHLATGEDSCLGIAEHRSCLADQSLSRENLFTAGSQGGRQSVIIDKNKQECIREAEVSSVLSDLTAKSEDCDEVLRENDEKRSIEAEPSTSKMEMVGSEPSTRKESCQDIINGEKNETVMVSGDTGLSSPITNDVTNPARNSPPNISTTEQSNYGTGVKGLSDQSFDLLKVNDGYAGQDKLVSKDLKQPDGPKEDKSFSFQNKAGKEPQSSTVKASIPISERTSTTFGLGISDPKIAQNLSHQSLKASNVVLPHHGGSKGSSEHKARRSSSKSTGKVAAKKRNPVKESAPGRIGGDKMSSVSLNTSAAVFQQPFTDVQQVQLRAQIFVYGALIQGMAPDEAYMMSAFGGPDGGRSIWEKAWHSCIERLSGQKLHPVTPETPLPSSLSGSRAPDLAIKQGVTESKATSAVGRANGNSTPSTTGSPMVHFSSPLWSVASSPAGLLQPSAVPRVPVIDFQRALSPLHPLQNTPMRSFVGPNASWISQAPFNGPWVTLPLTSALDSSTRFPGQLPATEPVQSTPVKNSSVLNPSAPKHVAPFSAGQSGFSTGALAGASTSTGMKNVSLSSSQPAAETKSRRRKKTLVSENLAQVVEPSQPQTETVCMPDFSGQSSCSVAVAPVIGFTAKVSTEGLITSSVSTPSTDARKVNQNAEMRPMTSEEALGKVKEARVQAEEASTLAAAAVSHSQEIWNQLDMKRKSGLVPDIEAKLTTAAVAIAAAAAVAKAAAAAANVASNAALQAKLMADEAAAGGYDNASQGNARSFSDGMRSLGKATPVSILKGDHGVNGSSAILFAARENAKRRVEAASAASKHAENMDAIVKAAELAAEAVSQAGKIVAMGNLSPLVEASPEGFQNVAQVTSEPACRSHDLGTEILKTISAGGSDASASQLKEISSDKKETQMNRNGKRSRVQEMPDEDHMRLIDVLSGIGAASAKDAKGQKDCKAADSAKTIGMVPASEMGTRSTNDSIGSEILMEAVEKQHSIREGSHVEVFRDGNGVKTAWFSAKVMSLSDGKAYVCYNELISAQGGGKLKEWVELYSEGDMAPKVRIAHPITLMPVEGTRKRRRSAMGDYKWSTGDKVDAWIRDSWWEGIVTEKSKKDDAMVTVYFPAHGETVVVRTWHLRPSLVWKDRKWKEWSSFAESSRSSHGGDTPQEKRPRVQSPALDPKGKGKTSKGTDVTESDRPEEPTLPDLSDDEKLFNIGKSTRENKNTFRTTRTGLQKEGTKVIFGVPKPGKKRKFMEVSKHYVADQSRKPNDSVKFAKLLMPQGSSRGWNNSTKTASNNKRAVVSNPKVSKSRKHQNVSGISIPRKGHTSITAISSLDDKSVANRAASTKYSENLSENTSKDNHKDLQSLSSSEGPAQGSTLFSSLALSSDTVASNRRSASTSKFDRSSKGKLAPVNEKLGKREEGKVLDGDLTKLTTDAVETRRSNRRIQPTSRLLEGLQTSLMASSVPHDKGYISRSTRGNIRG